MKSLADVIKAYEVMSQAMRSCKECPYCDVCYDHYTCECCERDEDVLHYLKEYQDLLNKKGE